MGLIHNMYVVKRVKAVCIAEMQRLTPVHINKKQQISKNTKEIKIDPVKVTLCHRNFQ